MTLFEFHSCLNIVTSHLDCLRWMFKLGVTFIRNIGLSYLIFSRTFLFQEQHELFTAVLTTLMTVSWESSICSNSVTCTHTGIHEKDKIAAESELPDLLYMASVSKTVWSARFIHSSV